MFEMYDADKDALLQRDEMLEGMKKDLKDQQAVKDTLDMLTSLFQTYDKTGNGLDRAQFNEFAHVTDHTFGGDHEPYDPEIHGHPD